jgi:hypothetical protein
MIHHLHLKHQQYPMNLNYLKMHWNQRPLKYLRSPRYQYYLMNLNLLIDRLYQKNQ